MARRNDKEWGDILLGSPWWASLVAGALAYLTLAYLVRAIPFPGLIGKAFGPLAHAAALPVALAFCACAAIVYFKQRQRRRLLDTQRDLESIRALSWQDFERLVGEAFRRQGFSVEERGGAAPDGGIDLVLRRDGGVMVVQCKHWCERRVGVEPIRELYGVMTAERASGALFITSGSFTTEAAAFAQTKPIGLIDGPALLELVEAVQSAHAAANHAFPDAPTCHVCSRPMVQRIERHGFRREVFWACSGYPHCKGNRPLEEAA
jgi:restriction system protein